MAATGALFHPFRALGYITADVPFAVQRRGRNTFLTVSAGKAWQIYNCAKLTLIFVGQTVRRARGRRSRASRQPCNRLRRLGLAAAGLTRCPACAQLERNITALASKDDFTFAAYGPHVAAFRRCVTRATHAPPSKSGLWACGSRGALPAQSAPHRHLARRGRGRDRAAAAGRPAAVPVARRTAHGAFASGASEGFSPAAAGR
jgi:hypothetical protein